MLNNSNKLNINSVNVHKILRFFFIIEKEKFNKILRRKKIYFISYIHILNVKILNFNGNCTN